MKITKVRTKKGDFCAPVSTSLEAVVSRMQQAKTKDVAEVVERNAIVGRLMEEEGRHRYLLEGADALPYMIFGATFGRGGFEDVRSLTGLLLLDIRCAEGHRQVTEMRRKVSQVPYTLLAFAGISGVTLKVVVRVDYRKEGDIGERDIADYLAYMKDARSCAYRIYQSLVNCDVYVDELKLVNGCRMSYDDQLYYQPDAQLLPVIRQESDMLQPYEGTQVEDNGEVVWYPEYDERRRLQVEYETCLLKALNDEPADMERALQLLADYCQKACLSEEACVTRTLWKSRFTPQGEDVIRKVFRSTFKKPYDGRPLTQMNEKERIMRSIEDFLTRRYELRYNVVKQQTEFRLHDLVFKPWQPLTDRQLKSLVVEEMKEGGESWMNDMRTYIESAHIQDYNPVLEFLAGCGEWDGKKDYIEDFARRLPTSFELWPQYFHRWFLAMVAQALNMNRDYGNSMVPMLIGGQGIKKSTFCKNILPPSMREYYMDDIKMDNAEQVERVLSRMWLVNIDEYNSKTDR